MSKPAPMRWWEMVLCAATIALWIAFAFFIPT